MSKKSLVILILAILIVAIIITGVFFIIKPKKEANFTVNPPANTTNYVFQIRWENSEQDAIITITSPSGRIYTNVNNPSSYITDRMVIFNVGHAEQGDWLVNIKGESLGKVTLDAGELAVETSE